MSPAKSLSIGSSVSLSTGRKVQPGSRRKSHGLLAREAERKIPGRKDIVKKGRESAKGRSRSEKCLEGGRGGGVKGSSAHHAIAFRAPVGSHVASRAPSQPSLFRTQFSKLLCFTVSTG